MTTGETSIVFAGLDGRSAAQLPDWYARTHDNADVVSFAEAIRSLPRATTTGVAYENPFTGGWVATDRFNAIVEPTRLVQQASDLAAQLERPDDAESVSTDGGTAVDPLFHVPSHNYAVINPTDVYGPLETVLADTTLDGHALSDVVFGEIRTYRGGGEVHMDVLFDGLTVDLPGRDPITMGVSSGYDYFGGHAVYVEGFARDSACANSIRSLTDREAVKHVGDVGDFAEWWTGVLDQLDLLANDLHAFITDAQEITIDFRAAPFTVEAFYDLLGFPEYLCGHAASDVIAEPDDPFDADLWTLHSGATYALTHHYRGKEGSSLDTYVRVANDVLFNPSLTVERVERAYEQRATDETSTDGQTGVESQVALAQLERVARDVREKAAQFESRQAVLRERFADH